MMFDQDPNEQANISGADFAIMCDEMNALRAELAQEKQNFKDVHEDYQSCSRELHKRNLELEAVKQQLAECEQELDHYKQKSEILFDASYDLSEQLTTCQQQRDELVAALEAIGSHCANPITQYGYGESVPWVRLADFVFMTTRDALAKLGADKGE